MTELTHADSSGKSRMVDVGAKEVTHRVARAGGSIRMRAETLALIRGNEVAKGDVLGVARIAGTMAAKRCDELIPLCHTIALNNVSVEFAFDESLPGIRVEAEASCLGRTGVEMEALLAATTALLTIYDMAKAVDRGMQITDVMLISKSGGRSGTWER